MTLLTDDQKMLQETAASFLAEEGAIAKQLRHWRDIGCKDGFGHGLWKQFAELGLTGICIPESHGGLGLGATEAALVLEEIGRNLTPSPFLGTAVAAARAIEGTAHAERWYPGKSCRATRCWRWRSTKDRVTRPSRRRSTPSGRATGSSSTAPSVRGPGRLGRHDRHRRAHRRGARRDARASHCSRCDRTHPASQSTMPRWSTARRRRG